MGLAALLAVVVGAVGLIWFATTPLFAEMVNEQAANNQAAANAGSTWNMQLTTPNNADLDAAEVEALNEKVINSRTYSYGSTFMVGFLGLIVSVLARSSRRRTSIPASRRACWRGGAAACRTSARSS